MTTDQRLCVVRFCGHPESSHFCEDEGGPEPYHGDDWCVDCEKPGTAHEFKPQPTPTPSLEEARKRLYWKIQAARSHMTMVREADEAFAEYDAHIKAAARAEVIREVEAAIRGKLGVTSRALTVVRALSQGGEGKA